MRTYWLFITAAVVLEIIVLAGMHFYQEYQHMYEAAHYTDNLNIHCHDAPTWGITDWNIVCNDGYTYNRSK